MSAGLKIDTAEFARVSTCNLFCKHTSLQNSKCHLHLRAVLDRKQVRAANLTSAMMQQASRTRFGAGKTLAIAQWFFFGGCKKHRVSTQGFEPRVLMCVTP
jgi:hypothetical protein